MSVATAASNKADAALLGEKNRLLQDEGEESVSAEDEAFTPGINGCDGCKKDEVGEGHEEGEGSGGQGECAR
jgi:hypothetical protein